MRERLRGGGKAEAESGGTARLPLPHTTSENGEIPRELGPEVRHPTGPAKPSNPPDAEAGGPTVESPCGSERHEQTG